MAAHHGIDLYAVLGVDAGASVREIRSAYRKLALRLHPDKNGGVHSDEFLKVQLAYEILRDEESRTFYRSATGGDRAARRTACKDPGPAFYEARRKAFEKEFEAASKEWKEWRDALFAQLDAVIKEVAIFPATPEKARLLESMIRRIDETRDEFSKCNSKREDEEAKVEASSKPAQAIEPGLEDFILFLEAKMKKTKKKKKNSTV